MTLQVTTVEYVRKYEKHFYEEIITQDNEFIDHGHSNNQDEGKAHPGISRSIEPDSQLAMTQGEPASSGPTQPAKVKKTT